MNKEEILNKVREAGVIGAGGGGFPAHKKLEAKVEHIIDVIVYSFDCLISSCQH